MYNVDFYAVNPQSGLVELDMYVNLASYLPSEDTISGGGTGGKYIILAIRGRNTNYQRNIIAKPVSGMFSNPQYEYNDRYYKISFRVYYPVGLYIPGGLGNTDTLGKRLLGEVPLPADETYDIKYYYDNNATVTIFNSSGIMQVDGEIEGISTVLNVTQHQTGDDQYNNPWLGLGDAQPISFYNQYTDNDQKAENLTSGAPDSAEDDKRDVQYGVQPWTPNY